MAVKRVVICLTLGHFIVQLVFSHITHSLTLLVDSYHVLCKLIFLFGSVLCTAEHNDCETVCKNEKCEKKVANGEDSVLMPLSTVDSKSDCHTHSCSHPHPERKMMNTFGWARIEVVVMLGGCVFLAALTFSLVVEAVQTLIHIDHQDPMHQPLSVFIIGFVGLLIHGLCYLLLGGPIAQNSSVPGNEILTTTPLNSSLLPKQKIQMKYCRLREICRDVVGCLTVMICSIAVHYTKPAIAKYIDPGTSIIAAAVMLYLKYPIMKESGLILLQTMPDRININTICKDLMKTFPDIVNVHELHIWQMTEDKIVSTAHIIFYNPQDYLRINNEVIQFFHTNGILEVTIQPEFFKDEQNIQLMPEYGMGQCLIQCNNVMECFNRNCCELNDIKLTEQC
ncbi:Cation efflux protein [Cinara cedri]|uniref:Cation efflux protein n=1 Tax=Cinara cedri TaxID=506608 RepID=A0A5E4MSU3_9HEMI|nr:Cation efflux protein [Cinara cedri]